MPPEPERNSQNVTKSPTSIRAAVIEDLIAILALEQASPTAGHWSEDHYRSRILSQPQNACFLVANMERERADENRIQGFICARVVAHEWEIENVVVDQEFRRHGIGSQLMQSLIKNWEVSAGTALLLEVRESNAAARALYECHGLREVGCRRAYYSNPPEDAILYARHYSAK
jgi:ribosomal-protein-alanine N-acetyltransferase